jgi:quercetin dioxygenase-like cupin family protein
LVQARKEILDSEGYGLIFLKKAIDTDGQLLEMEAFYRPQGKMPPPHYHPYQEEHFKVVCGEFRVLIGNEILTYKAGDSFTIPVGVSHGMHNISNEKGQLHWRTCPALNSEGFFETVWKMEQDQPNGRRGLGYILRLAAAFQQYRQEVRLTSNVQRVLLKVLAPIGRFLGS